MTSSRGGANPLVLETDRLILREMGHGDLDFVAGLLAHPRVMRFYKRPYTREEAGVWVKRQVERYRAHGHALWLVLEREAQEPVGQVGLVRQRVEEVSLPEIGYMIHCDHWRQGYATEAALAVREYAFNELGKDEVFSLIRPENVPSQGVARKLGMTERRRVTYAELPHVLFGVAKGER